MARGRVRNRTIRSLLSDVRLLRQFCAFWRKRLQRQRRVRSFFSMYSSLTHSNRPAGGCCVGGSAGRRARVAARSATLCCARWGWAFSPAGGLLRMQSAPSATRARSAASCLLSLARLASTGRLVAATSCVARRCWPLSSGRYTHSRLPAGPTWSTSRPALAASDSPSRRRRMRRWLRPPSTISSYSAFRFSPACRPCWPRARPQPHRGTRGQWHRGRNQSRLCIGPELAWHAARRLRHPLPPRHQLHLPRRWRIGWRACAAARFEPALTQKSTRWAAPACSSAGCATASTARSGRWASPAAAPQPAPPPAPRCSPSGRRPSSPRIHRHRGACASAAGHRRLAAIRASRSAAPAVPCPSATQSACRPPGRRRIPRRTASACVARSRLRTGIRSIQSHQFSASVVITTHAARQHAAAVPAACVWQLNSVIFFLTPRLPASTRTDYFRKCRGATSPLGSRSTSFPTTLDV